MNSQFLNSPFLLGFERLGRPAKPAGDGYPPYNIEALDEGLRLTLAVAGFGPGDIAITVEDRQLVIRGRQNEPPDELGDKKFLHRGIAARQFSRRFALADGIEVRSAALENGLLKVDLERQDLKPSIQVVEIKSGGLS